MDPQPSVVALDARFFQIGEVTLRFLIAMDIPPPFLREELLSEHALQGAELQVKFDRACAQRQ